LQGTVKSGLWWFSNMLVLGGSMAYTMVRRSEMMAATDRATPAAHSAPPGAAGEPPAAESAASASKP
jgi:hypothetical protein